MLEKDRFLAIKRLARNVRKENEELFEAFAKESPNDAISEKEEFVETVIDSLDFDFSSGDLGKEEKQIFRANVLIPDDEEFLKIYSQDKNIRNLMNIYAVSIEDIMSKITELNIYAEYLREFEEEEIEPKEEPVKEEPKRTNKFVLNPSNYISDFTEEEEKENEPFVAAASSLSSTDAESLLDEIENLSNAMEMLGETTEDFQHDFSLEDELPSNSAKDIITPEEPKEQSYYSDMSLDDISEAVDGFVEEYNTIQTDLENFKTAFASSKRDNDKLKDQIKKFKDEIYKLKHDNLETEQALKDSKKENKNL